jgi:DNA-binding NarL/FixJ family response regulator
MKVSRSSYWDRFERASVTSPQIYIVYKVIKAFHFHKAGVKIAVSNGEVILRCTLNELTERQREVYNLIISGKTNKEIMTELFIEQSTLKSHINQIYKKLNIKKRSELKLKR